MPTVVRLRESGEFRVLLGTGYGMHKAFKPQAQIFGTIASSEESAEVFLVALCDRDGAVSWGAVARCRSRRD